MDCSPLCAVKISEDIIYKPFLFSPSCMESCIKNNQCTAPYERLIPQKDVSITAFSKKEDLIVQVCGIALPAILHVHDTRARSAGSNSNSDQDVIYSQKEMQSLSLDTNMEEGSGNSGATLSSEECLPNPKEMQSFSLDTNMEEGSGNSGATLNSEECSSNPNLPMDGREELLGISLHKEGFEAPVNAHSPTLPSYTVKLVSAMKGGREQHGMALKTKLSVKWAPEVYDPPVTSSSHTVKGHRHRRSIAKKKDHCQHKNKGKSSRGSSNERKHTTRRSTFSITDSQALRFQAPSDRLLLNGLGQSVELLDRGVVKHELNCGSSYYMEPIANVHCPTAKAS